jgi:ribose/xylose/arabinose/galactoside ABC-type transport system permease subunit
VNPDGSSTLEAPAPAPDAALPRPGRGRHKLLASSRRAVRELALLPAIVLAMVVGTFVHGAFLTSANLTNMLAQSTVLGVLVIAETLILLVGRFDLSLESVVGLAPMVSAWLITPDALGGLGLDLPPAVAMATALAVGAAVGAFNGVLVVKLRLNAFIVTLAMLILLRGIDLGIGKGQTFYNLPAAFLYLGTANWLGIPASVWVVAAMFGVTGAFLRYHRVGRAMYAIGGNPVAARAAGIRVDRIIIGVYVVGGLLAAFAGLLETARISAVTGDLGQNLIFYVFAAAVIGGVSLDGGRGRMAGALSGVLLLGIVQNLLTLSQVQAFWINACFGAIILVSLVISRLAGGSQDGAL